MLEYCCTIKRVEGRGKVRVPRKSAYKGAPLLPRTGLSIVWVAAGKDGAAESDLAIERDGRACGFSAGLAFPMMADFSGNDEFRMHRGDHPVAAIAAARRRRKSANRRNRRPIALKPHVFGSSFLISNVAVRLAGDHGDEWTGR
jgi:hypothetical protein